MDRCVFGGEESRTVMEVRAVLLACFGSVKQMVSLQRVSSKTIDFTATQHLQHLKCHQERRSHNPALIFAVQRFSCTNSPVLVQTLHPLPPFPFHGAWTQDKGSCASTAKATVTHVKGSMGDVQRRAVWGSIAKSTGTGTRPNVPAGHGRRGRIAAEAG